MGGEQGKTHRNCYSAQAGVCRSAVRNQVKERREMISGHGQVSCQSLTIAFENSIQTIYLQQAMSIFKPIYSSRE